MDWGELKSIPFVSSIYDAFKDQLVAIRIAELTLVTGRFLKFFKLRKWQITGSTCLTDIGQASNFRPSALQFKSEPERSAFL